VTDPRRIARFAPPVAAVALLAAAVPASGENLSILLLAAGLAIAGAFVATWLGPGDRALLLAATGVALILSVSVPLAGAETARGLAIAATPLVLPLAGASLMRSPRLIALALAGGVLAGPVRALLYDPFLDPSCSACRSSALALTPDLHLADLAQSAGGALTLIAVCVAALRSARGFFPLAVVACAVAATAGGADSDLVLAAGSSVAAGAVAFETWIALRARGRIEGLLVALRDRAEFAPALRDSLGDPGLTVAYWLEDERRFAGAHGEPPPVPAPGQAATDLRVGGRLCARVHHAAAAVGVPEVASALDAPARLVLENEALSARLAARVTELAASRTRIVEHADAERRHIERDLHDGAQQHVLALGFGLRVALAALPDAHRERAVLEECLAETMRALDDLRELSHGLYPASLSAGGLAPALRAMARRSAGPIDVGAVAPARFPPPVEEVAYALVADAAARASAGIAVSVVSGGSTRSALLSVHIDGVGGLPAGVLVDRVAAIGGTLVREERRIVAVLPCA
jgi:signal transduction histidine kinase